MHDKGTCWIRAESVVVRRDSIIDFLQGIAGRREDCIPRTVTVVFVRSMATLNDDRFRDNNVERLHQVDVELASSLPDQQSVRVLQQSEPRTVIPKLTIHS